MLRYLRAVQMMKQIIEDNNLTVMATIARYAAAYEAIAKLDWWDKSKRSVTRHSTSLLALTHSHTAAPGPSSSRARISATSRATLAAMSTSRPSSRTRSSGTSRRASSRSRKSTRARLRLRIASRASRLPLGSTRAAPSGPSRTSRRSRDTTTAASSRCMLMDTSSSVFCRKRIIQQSADSGICLGS